MNIRQNLLKPQNAKNYMRIEKHSTIKINATIKIRRNRGQATKYDHSLRGLAKITLMNMFFFNRQKSHK